MTPLLWRALLKHSLRHPWQLALAILGIALGVAVVLAVDLANASARRGFELTMNRVTGRATHQITGGPQGVPEAFYRHLRVERGIQQIAPVVTGYLPRADRPGHLFQILGVDPFAEGPFRAAAADPTGKDFDLRSLLLDPDAALLPGALGDHLTLQRGENRFILKRAGTLEGSELNGLIIADISTAQVLLGYAGRLSHIDVILPDGPAGERRADELRARLIDGLRLERSDMRNQATADLSAAFSLNLLAMSLLALVVGAFLIYNAISFAVVQRRGLLGILRALGVSRREIFAGILGEALLLGLAGSLLGSLLGVWIGSGLIHLVTRTINDFYYVLNVRDFLIDPWSLAKGVALGLTATLVAAWLPAREAAAVAPGAAMSRAHLETRWQLALPRLIAAGLLLFAGGGAVLWLSRSLAYGFVGLFLVIFGLALLTPPIIVGWVRLNRPLVARRGLLARMANRDVARHLSRTGIAVAALMVAFATTVGVGVMVDSFRGGVAIWIHDLLNADLYLAPPATGGDHGAESLRPATLAALRAAPGVAAVSTYRRATIDFRGRPVQLIAADLAPAAQRGYRLIAGDPAVAWRAFQTGESVLITEPLAYRQRLNAGDTLELATAAGPHRFAIAGVYLDYGSEHGRILIHRSAYERYWRDSNVSSAAAFAVEGADLTALGEHLQDRLGAIQPVMLRPNRDLQARTLEIFDRTFTITNVLRLLAILVSVVGVLSALSALQLERAREFAVLRAIGMRPGEIGALVSLQTGFMGAVAGLLAIPTGLVLALVLIFVINRRAFGWSLPFQVSVGLLAETVALATAAALLAGVYPIWRMSRARPAEALRTD
ncbi:MAG: FtsX-like permease family protein [Candidatus Competibacteraceae bacterium]|nr:FtsX-like permease family protein [Candidatus Competibacteraceae bacterium]